jgi:hypothetical protein
MACRPQASIAYDLTRQARPQKRVGLGGTDRDGRRAATHPVTPLFAIFAGALAYLWWPASWMMGWFIERLRRRARIDSLSLWTRRRKQLEQELQGEPIPTGERIAAGDIFDLPAEIIGRTERLLAFSLCLAFGLEGSVVTVLVAWIGAKLLANWQRQSGGGSTVQDQICAYCQRADRRNAVTWSRRFLWLACSRFCSLAAPL